MPAEIRAKISVDTDDLSRGEAKLRDFERAIQHTFRRDPGARGQRVLEGVIGDLTRGDFVGALTTIASKLNLLGLIGGAALGLVAVGIKRSADEAKKFRDSLAEVDKVLGRMPATGAGLEAISGHINDIVEAQKKLPKAPGMLETIFSPKQALASGAAERDRQEVQKRSVGLSQQYVRSLDQEIAKQRELNAITIERAAGHTKEADAMQSRVELGEKMAAIQAEATKRRQGIEEAVKEGSITRGQGLVEKGLLGVQTGLMLGLAAATSKAAAAWKELNENMEKAKGLTEKSGLSEEELMKGPRKIPFATVGQGEVLGGAQFLAGRAKAEEDKAEKERLAGHRFGPTGALAHEFSAERIKSGIGLLKESEKMTPETFKAALDGAQVFKSIEGELKTLNGKFDKLTFQNQ